MMPVASLIKSLFILRRCERGQNRAEEIHQNQIMTTGLAGGLTQSYKGMMPAALEAP